MAKDKLFTPEDFDKEPKKPKYNYIKWVVTAIIVIVTIIAMVFGLKECVESNNKSENTESPQLTVTTDSDTVVAHDYNDITISHSDKDSSDEVRTSNENQSSKTEPVQNDNTTNDLEISSDIETEALKVIRGEYGNNPERRTNLGSKYQPIQDRVNELKRQGMF